MSQTPSRNPRSSSRRSAVKRAPPQPVQLGQRAAADGWELRSYEVGALPLINTFLGRMRLSEILSEHLPVDDPRTELPTVRALLVLVRNVLLARLVQSHQPTDDKRCLTLRRANRGGDRVAHRLGTRRHLHR